MSSPSPSNSLMRLYSMPNRSVKSDQDEVLSHILDATQRHETSSATRLLKSYMKSISCICKYSKIN